MTLDELAAWAPTRARPRCRDELRADGPGHRGRAGRAASRRLQQLGLGYLSLDRASSTLSTGERQRVQLARAVRNRTTGVLYVLDEPSIGLHPSNVEGLLGVMDDLLADGNSVVVVDHDVRVLTPCRPYRGDGPWLGRRTAAWSIAQGTRRGGLRRARLAHRHRFWAGRGGCAPASGRARARCSSTGPSTWRPGEIHTVRPLSVDIPRGRLTAVTGVSGSGKTTLVLESLISALAGEHRRRVRCLRTY